MATSELDLHLQRIANSEPRAVAFFDLDGTLLAGYSVVALSWELARAKEHRRELKGAMSLLTRLLTQRSAQGSYEYLTRQLAQALAGVEEARLSELGKLAFERHLARNLYREAIAVVEAHRAAGHHLVIVSAASYYQIAPIANALGISDIQCTRLTVEHGRFTGELGYPLCHAQGKAQRAAAVCRRIKRPLRYSWFYGDSKADIPLLERVGYPVATNAQTALLRVAQARAWPQLRFATRGRPTTEQLGRTLLTGQALASASLAARLMGRSARRHNLLTQALGDVVAGCAGLEIEVEGDRQLLETRPAVFVFNHQSLLDAMVLAYLLRRDIVGLCKQEMADNSLLGPILRRMDTIFVEREASDQSAVLQLAMTALSAGRGLVIAPEGTRSTLGQPQAFKHGALLLARKAQVPVIPLVLHNVKDALPKGGLILRPARIRITVLPAIQPEDIRSIRRTGQALEAQYRRTLSHSPLAALPRGQQA
jgi:putative phosphoserine phosphatase/1-acylglycerol-3-phosphate O-acyltransferase